MKKQQLKPLTLKQNSIWNVVGSMIYALTQWGLLITIARYSNPELVGVFTLGLAIAAPMLLFFNLNLRIALVTDDNKNNFDLYWTFRLITSGMFFIILLILVTFYLNDFYTLLVCIFIGISKFFESLSDIMFGVMQKNQRMDLIAKSQILKGFCTLLVFMLSMSLTGSLLISTIFMSLVWLIVLVLFDYNNLKKFEGFSIHFSKKQILLFKITLPLGIAQLITSLNANVPRYFIEYSHGLKELGVYASLIYIVAAGNNLIIALSNILLPILSTAYNSNNIKSFTKIMLYSIITTVILGVFGLSLIYSFGDDILLIIYGEEFSNYVEEFLIIGLYGIIMYIGKFIETGLNATR